MSLSMHWLTAQTVTRRTWDPGVNELMVANRWISCAARSQKVYFRGDLEFQVYVFA